MFLRRYYPPEIDHTIPHAVIDAIQKAAETMAKYSAEAYRIESRPRGRPGKTLRPGKQTPLWNELRRQLRPHLRRYGTQVNLGRLLGCPASASMPSSPAAAECRTPNAPCNSWPG